jgi:ketosteroid isomerase-like protein
MFERTAERLLDREQIREIIYRYCRAVDRGDLELLATVYQPDATEAHGGFRGSATDFVHEYVPTVLAGMLQGMHHVTNISIEFEGDVALTESYLVCLYVKRNGDVFEEHTIYSRYLDRFERRDDSTWLIAQRTLVTDWASERTYDSLPVYPPPGHLRSTRDEHDLLYSLLRTGRVSNEALKANSVL